MNALKARRPARPVRAAVVAALLAVPALSACSSTNFDAPTDQYYTPSDGENAREGTVDVLHALIISDTPGSGRLIAGLANGADEEDTLTGVRGLDEAEGVEFSILEGETAIPGSGVLQLADDGSAVVAVNGDPEVVDAGGYVRVAFSFRNGEEVPINVPVLAPGEDYDEIELPESSTGDTTGAEG